MNGIAQSIKKVRLNIDIRMVNSLSRVLILVMLSLGMSLLSPVFLTNRNILNIITTASIPAILAVAQTIVVLTANIDLSIGSIFAIAGVTTGVLLKSGNIPAPYAVFAGLAMGASLGFINGLLVAVIKLPPFIATYGVSFTAYGLASGILKGYVIYGFPDAFRFIGNGKFYGIPMAIILAGIIVFLMWLLLTRTTFGRRVFALGANAEAARMSGINTKGVLILVYVLSGFIAAFAGIVQIARINAADVELGTTLLQPTIAAVVIGGTSMYGGEGGVGGTVVGALTMGIIQNALILLGVPTLWQQFILGLFIIVAILADQAVRRLTGRRSN
jgi:ribose/xylose/arabinose/galactoside ABC-type transport system permease subunit